MRINLWNVEDNRTVFNIIDLKSKEEADEVITHSEFHPQSPTIFTYTTSKGILNVCDFRDGSSFQKHSSFRFDVGEGQKKNAFSDMLNTFSCCKFIKNKPNLIATRDFLSAKIWDIRGTSHKPSISINVCDYLEKNLVNLYEDDSIYDRFFMDVSPCGNFILTGAYNKNAHILDIYGNNNVTLTTSFD
jgi:serine/threonine-protein phosphatase 2A regulatory subunit B